MSAIEAILVDFGNVICSWTPVTNGRISTTQLKSIMSSDIWADYERGKHREEECYELLARRFAIDPQDMVTVMAGTRKSVQVHHDVVACLRQIQEQYGLKLYGMTNTPAPEQDIIYSISRQWLPMDHIYISGEVGMRKPDVSFYEHVLNNLTLPAKRVLFVDDRPENVLAAESIGVKAILFQDPCRLSHHLEDYLE